MEIIITENHLEETIYSAFEGAVQEELELRGCVEVMRFVSKKEKNDSLQRVANENKFKSIISQPTESLNTEHGKIEVVQYTESPPKQITLDDIFEDVKSETDLNIADFDSFQSYFFAYYSTYDADVLEAYLRTPEGRNNRTLEAALKSKRKDI